MLSPEKTSAGNSLSSFELRSSSWSLLSPEKILPGKSASLFEPRSRVRNKGVLSKMPFGSEVNLFSLRSRTCSRGLCCKSSCGSTLSSFPSTIRSPYSSDLPPSNNCSRAGMGRSKSSGNTFKRFWLRDKILKLDNPANVSDSTCCKPKRPKSSSCKLSKGANTFSGKTDNRFPESDNRCKPREEVKASSAILVMFAHSNSHL